MLVKLLETFFRHPLLHLIPLVVFVALGCFTAFSAEKTYRSVGVLNATSGPLLSELTGNTPTFGYESTAEVTSRNVNQLLATDYFLDDVIERARLTTAVANGLVDRNELRGSISAHAQGDNLIAVSASTPRPEQSQLLAQATLDAFVDWVVESDIGDADLRIDTYTDILERNQDAYDEVAEELREYLINNPAGDEQNRPAAQLLDIARLQDVVDRADEAVADAQTNLDEANLASEVARTVVTRQLRTVDVPQVPSFSESGLRDAAMTILIFTFLGVMLSLGTIVAASMLDRTIRIPDELSAKFGVEVLAVVPSARR